ncbi:hypothetical protein LPJ66_004517 [Kickxella alabastrina]|uniref:Uncharacterized protein n=1 Tax=Kickxella alabastrina TaxID=61397 RepID=A0ACC1IMM8_9FUNG|nr:hypothetical protein LPJ66_004517 [Kickxella alabastrina]
MNMYPATSAAPAATTWSIHTLRTPSNTNSSSSSSPATRNRRQASLDGHTLLFEKERSIDQEHQNAIQAYDLLDSIRGRQNQLGRYLQEFSTFKSNPLGSAMCNNLEDKIHQMALLISRQQVELKRIIDKYDQSLVRSESTTSRVSSLEEWEEEMQTKKFTLLPGCAELQNQEAPVTNWLSTSRMSTLKEVIEFSANDLKRIEASSLFTKYPPPPPPRKRTPSMSSLSSYNSSSYSGFL